MQEEDYFITMVIRHRLGYYAAKVASCLLSTSSQTIPQIQRATGLDINTIASALTAMMQHDVVTCHSPFLPEQPPKAIALRRQLNEQNGISNDNDDMYPTGTEEVAVKYEQASGKVSSEFGVPESRLFGNIASGWTPHNAVVYFNIVHNPISPAVVLDFDMRVEPLVKQHLFSLNGPMVRGLSRVSFYSGFIHAMLSSDCRMLIEEVGFRGKLTPEQIIVHTTERLLSEMDHELRTAAKLQDGTDPLYEAAFFNAATPQTLASLSVWAFDIARKTPNVSSAILKQLDDIELSRYEALLPRVSTAFNLVMDFHLLTVSPGFIDAASFQNMQHEQLSSSSTTSSSVAAAAASSISSASPFSSSTLPLTDRKRKATSAMLSFESHDDQVVSVTKRSRQTTTSIPAADDDDAFSAAILPSPAIPLTNSTTTTSSLSLTADSTINSNNNTSSFIQRPIILNHDRFTLLIRGEIIVDYIARKVCPVAALIVGAINFHICRQITPHDHNQITAQQIIDCFPDYIRVRRTWVLPSTLNETAHHISQLPILDSVFNLPPEINFSGLLHYIAYFAERPLTQRDVIHAMKRLAQQSSGPLPSERSYVIISKLTQPGGSIDINTDAFSNDENAFYIIKFDAIAQGIRLQYVRTHVQVKYGAYAARLVGVLSDFPRLEDKQIGDFGLVPKRITKELLHTMLSDGVVQLLEVPTSTDTLNTTAKSFYLWSLDYTQGGTNMLRVFYKTFANTLQRLDTEREKRQVYVDKLLLSEHILIPDEDKKIGYSFKPIYARAMNSLLGVMKAIIMFNDLNPH